MSIESILAAERKKHNLPVQKLSEFIYTPQFYQKMKEFFPKTPHPPYDPNLYNKDRLQIIKDSFRYLPVLAKERMVTQKGSPLDSGIEAILGTLLPHAVPGSVHTAMFVTILELMGTEEHKQKYLQKAKTYEIVGAYAQTQIGHGSDVRGLETVANFDEKTQEWIINTPSLSAAKYWPGELSFIANYAIVHAQAMLGGKSQGVFPFLVEIKDKNYDWMPGIEGGDIGPKIGLHAKENGFMMLHNVRIPKDNLLSKYVRVTEKGKIETVGDPRVGYGTMMHVREQISCLAPKKLAQAIIIAGRYALFRRQFRDNAKKEIAIIEYQLQQDKIFSRIAEYYALAVAGNRILKVANQNSEKILKKDFSLLQETHSTLAFSKCFFSEIVQDGMELLRRSLGGHGTSYYSGIPEIVTEFMPNNTWEGENTVMYIQTARYVLKSYAKFLNGKPLTDSVSYIADFPKVQDLYLQNNSTWSMEDMLNVFHKAISFVVQDLVARLSSKKSTQNDADVFAYEVGGRLQHLALLHSNFYTLKAFIDALNAESNPYIKPILADLCMLFGAGQIEKHAQPIIEANTMSSDKFKSLIPLREGILARLRPSLSALLDSLAIPDHYVRSQLAHGQPYNNFLDRARQCEINEQVQESAKMVAHIPEVLSRHRPNL